MPEADDNTSESRDKQRDADDTSDRRRTLAQQAYSGDETVAEADEDDDDCLRVQQDEGFIETANDDVLHIRQQTGFGTLETSTVIKLNRKLTSATDGELPLYSGVFEPVETGPGDLPPAISVNEGPREITGRIDGNGFRIPDARLVDSTPDPDFGGFKVTFAPGSPGSWVDEALDEQGVGR